MRRPLRAISIMSLVAVLAAGGVCAADAVPRLTSAERSVVPRGAIQPVIIALADGSLGLVVEQPEAVGPARGTNVWLEWLRSADAGRTWSKPVVVSKRLGPNGELFRRRPEGGYIVFQQRNQALGQLPSGRIVCAVNEQNYYYDSNGRKETRPGKNYNQKYMGVAYMWSDDLGRTWSKPRRLPQGPFGARGGQDVVAPMWRIVTLQDGTALMSLYGECNPDYSGPVAVPKGTGAMAGVIRSTDNGETWGDISLIFTKPSDVAWEEPVLCVLDDRIIAHMRTARHNVEQYTSTDNGRTWQGPVQITQRNQHPGGAFRLASGNVMMTWGNRRAPFGAMGMLSYDGGKTWDYEHRVSIAWDAHGFNCGYGNGAQAGDGTIVVVYYDMPVSGDYRKMWDSGKVYTVRFTEEQFLATSRGE